MLSIGKKSVAHAAYYTAGRAVGSAGYYTDGGDTPGRWVNAGGLTVAAGAVVTHQALQASLSAVEPNTGEQLGRRFTVQGTFVDQLGIRRERRPCAAFDLTFSPPKSISVAWALSDPHTRAHIEAAFDTGVHALVDYMQTWAVASRKGAGGTERVEVPQGAPVARFDHRTSRSGDPQLHSHLLFHNRVLCEDGKWRTLDGRLIYRHLMPASLYGAAVLRTELSRRLGWSWDRVGDNLHAEIAGNPAELSEYWSHRSREIAREAQRRVRKFEKQRQRAATVEERLELWNAATIASRATKRYGVGEDPHTGWRTEAAALGVEPEQQLSLYRTAQRLPPDRYDRPEVIVTDQIELSTQVIDHILATAEQQANRLTDIDLKKTIYTVITAGPVSARLDNTTSSVEAVERLADILLRLVQDRLIKQKDRWYSPGMVAAEVAIVAWMQSIHPSATTSENDSTPQEREPDKSDTPARTLLDQTDLANLGSDQAAAVTTLLTAHTNGAIVVGPAGSGKTVMLQRVAEAVGHEKVVAVAPTAVAAATLGNSLGVPSDTLARIVTQHQPLPHRAWVIVDEAGMVSTRDLAALCGKAAATQGKVILVGDPAQQNAIAAGGMFTALAKSGTTPSVTLSELWRFQERSEALATIKIRLGDISGLSYHIKRHRVQEATHPEVAGLAGDWWQPRREQHTVISAQTSTLMHEINSEIARRRHALGETGDTIQGTGVNTIRVGDIILTRRNSRHLVDSNGEWVRNGDRWTVRSAHRGRLTVQRYDNDSQALLRIPEEYALKHVQLGYSITQTRAQSLSVDAAMTVITSNSRLNQLYVGLTRGKIENHLVVVTDQPDYDEDTPPPQLPREEVLQTVFSRRGGWETITDAHSTLPAQEASEHLQTITNTSHDQPLPHLDGLDVPHMLTQATTHQTTRQFEERIVEEIAEWAADYDDMTYDEQAHDEEQAAWDRRFLDYLASLGDQDFTPEGWDTYQTETTERPAPPLLDPWQHFAPGAAQASQIIKDALPHPPRIYSDAVTDAISALLVGCEQAHRTWNRQQISRHLAIMARVADPGLRRAIEAGFHTGTLTEPERRWADAVRTQALHQRAVRTRPLLDELDHLRETQAVETTTTFGAPEKAKVIQDTDRHQWWTHCQEWLENNEHPRELVERWHQANHHLKASLTSHSTTLIIEPLSQPPWQSLIAAQPPEPGRCPTAPLTGLSAATQTRHDAAVATLSDLRRAAARGRLPDRPTPPSAKDLKKACDAAADWYHKQLLYSPHAEPARRYLIERGLTPNDWKTWKLGWGGNTWRGACGPIGNDQLALHTGIAATSSKGTIYDRMRERIVFPIRNPAGETIAFAGRAITDQGPKYLNTPRTDLYHKSEVLYGLDRIADRIDTNGQAIMVEGYLDVIAAQKADLPAVAPCGTAATGDHLNQLEAAGCQHLTVCFDGDQAGTSSALNNVALPAFRQALSVSIAQLPQGTDPASVTPEELRQAITDAKSLPWATIANALQQAIDYERGGWQPIESTLRVSRTVQESLPLDQNVPWTHPDNTFPHLTNLVTAHLLSTLLGTDTDIFLIEQHRYHTTQPKRQQPVPTHGRAHVRTL